MTARRRLTERQVLEVLIVNHGAIIPCGICRLALKAEDLRYVERDHHRAKHTFLDEELDQWEAIDNQRYVHGLRDPNHDCHRRKTDGTKATTAGSDKHMAAKGRRLRGENKPKRKAKIQSRNTLSKEERDKARQWKMRVTG
jgi:hypothetical protein